ncbi:MAG: trypsin-like peptidase domain-containing protein [Caldilineaceae bacterium]
MAESIKQISEGMAAVVEASHTSIVRIDGRRRHAASGIVWAEDGVIVTAHHVVERDEGLHVGLPDGATVDATVIGRDPGIDLAVLRVTSQQLTPATWQLSDELKVGHLALAMGRPGHHVQATLGIVSALGGEWRTHAGSMIERYLQTDVVMYPGFSGGPLVGADGQFMGMNTSGLARGVSIAVPAITLQRVVKLILAHGHVPRGYLGIGVQPVRLAEHLQNIVGQETGLMVMSVESDGPAAQAGLVQGDVVVKLDDTPVRHADELQTFLSSDHVGKVLAGQILRGGILQELALTVGQSKGSS